MFKWLFGTKIQVPPKEWFEEVNESTQFSPDVAFLEKKIAHRVFLCDNTMEKRPYHHVLGDDSYKITNALTRDKFTFWNVRGDQEGRLAVPLTGYGERAPCTRIKGEMHLIHSEKILQLDRAYQNGVRFVRVKARLLVPFVPITDPQVDERDVYNKAVEQTVFLDKPVSAWMYVGVGDYWSDPLSKGTKVKFTDKSGQTTYSNISQGLIISPVRSFNNKKLGLYYYYTPYEFSDTNK